LRGHLSKRRNGNGCSFFCELSISAFRKDTEVINNPSRALLGMLVYGAAVLLVPTDEPIDPNGKIDWVGAGLGVAGLILFNFVWK
jgi:hypothetical protein